MKYTLELNETERAVVILALGRAYDIRAERTGEPGCFPAEIARRLIELSPSSPIATDKSAPVPSDVAPASGGRGVDPVSDGLDVREIGPLIPLSIVKNGTGKKERLLVEWRDGLGNLQRASCWANNKGIWPRVLEKVRQSVTFLVKEKSGYMSIVGVKP